MFLGVVVYMCEYNECGVFGLVINCFIDIDLVMLFDKIDFKFEIYFFVE